MVAVTAGIAGRAEHAIRSAGGLIPEAIMAPTPAAIIHNPPMAGMAAPWGIGADPGAIAATRPTMAACQVAAGNK